MTKSTGKPRRHPTFTIDELKAIRSALIDKQLSMLGPNGSSALSKVANAIAYREDYAAKLQQVRYGKLAKPEPEHR